jgi:hypothetical protein
MLKKISQYKIPPRLFREILVTVLVTLLILSAFLLVFFVVLKINNNMAIMQEIDQEEMKANLNSLLDKKYNYTELIQWEHDNLNFTWESIDRHTNPLEIIEYGKGRCGEFAILYVALCLSQGYRCRLVSNIIGDHEWAEIELNGTWVHVDPTEQRIDDNYMYEKNWKVPIILVCAFQGSSFEDVTNSYKTGFWINILSLRMLALLLLIAFILFSFLTYKSIRRLFYKQYRLKGGIPKSVGKWYENHLHIFYIVRLLFTFFLPFSSFVFIFGIVDASIILNLLVAGIALVTFVSIGLPALTQPKLYVSVWEHDGEKDIDFERLKLKKTENFVLRLRVANIGMHLLKKCTFFVTFPKNITIVEYQEDLYEKEDFSGEFVFQKVNNACVFPKSKDITLPPQDVVMLTVIIEKIEPFAKNADQKSRQIQVEINSESTWGSSKDNNIPIEECPQKLKI